jgi:ubiquinone/menaquinone biosynthesis C-methylase UbiE
MVLARSEAEAYYSRFGKKQDTQSFYEDAALDDLVAHADFESAKDIFELGCGTGRFASRLLSKHVLSSPSYLGVDLSQTMVDLARERITPFADRARVSLTDGSMHFPAADRTVDRVVSTYVFDLLSESDMHEALSESRRVLIPGGKLCLVSLTFGTTFMSHLVSSTWAKVFRLHASLVGGCRPIQLRAILGQQDWSIYYRNVIVKWGVPSEVIVASPADHPR